MIYSLAALQQIIQLSYELKETMMVGFLFDHGAQLVHAISLFDFHRQSDGKSFVKVITAGSVLAAQDFP